MDILIFALLVACIVLIAGAIGGRRRWRVRATGGDGHDARGGG